MRSIFNFRTVVILFAAIGTMFSGCGNPLQSDITLSLPAGSEARALADGASPLINEFVFNHTGSDTSEYVEVLGAADTDYSDYTVVEIEGDSNASGTIDGVLTVGSTDANGYWTTGFLSNEFENGSVTLLLVRNFTGAQGTDLDADDDGLLDSEPWDEIVDAVAVNDGGSADLCYTSCVLSSGFDGGAYTPGGASRIPDGTDTDSVDDWARNNFNLAGLPGVSGDPDAGEAYNTPGAENEYMPEEVILELSIPEIQGTDVESPYNYQKVKTSGVVTLITADGRSFWMQDAEGDSDPATSDGIYVYRGGDKADVSVGDLVEVTGTVYEYTSWSRPTDLPLTEISPAIEVTIVESGAALPDPVEIDRMPNLSIPEGAAFFETLEGMLISVDSGPVVGPTNAYGEFVILARKNARPGSGFVPSIGQIMVTKGRDGTVDYNPERIMVDDMSLDEAVEAAPGDRIRNLTGVVHYDYGNYKVEPVEIEVVNSGRNRYSRGKAPFPHRGHPRPHGHFQIATFNIENLFDLENNPDKDDDSSTPSAAELETKLSKLTRAFVDELQLPEIVIVQETENQAILQELGDRINAEARTHYEARSFETSDGRGIEAGFLFDKRKVRLVEAYQLAGEDVEAAFGPESASPGREPIVGVFRVGRETITLVGNHFKSKGGDEPLYGINWPPQRETEEQRKLQARVVRDFVNSVLDEDRRAMVIVAGDLNDFQFAEPGEGDDHPVGILEGSAGEVPLSNLINRVSFHDRFTYVYDGNSQVLDHMLVSPAIMARRPQTEIAHFNASYPDVYAEDPDTPHKSSDHDPIIMSLRLR